MIIFAKGLSSYITLIIERDKTNIETERKLEALKKFHNDNKLPVPLYGKLKRHI